MIAKNSCSSAIESRRVKRLFECYNLPNNFNAHKIPVAFEVSLLRRTFCYRVILIAEVLYEPNASIMKGGVSESIAVECHRDLMCIKVVRQIVTFDNRFHPTTFDRRGTRVLCNHFRQKQPTRDLRVAGL